MSLVATDIDDRIAARIRDLRTARGLTLDGLARQAEVSRAMLSRVERGESSPTAQLLNRICGGLGVTLSMLFAEAESSASPVSRRARQAVWRDPDSQYLRRHVSPAGGASQVDITEIEFPAGGSVAFDSQRLPHARQHVWVLEGSLEVQLGDEAFALAEGDCLLMRLDRPTAFRNPGRHAVRYAVIISHGAPLP